MRPGLLNCLRLATILVVIVLEPSQDVDDFATLPSARVPSPCLATNPPCLLFIPGAVSKPELDGPEPDDVSVSQRRLRLYSRATEQSTVRAAEVVQDDASLGTVDADTRVTAGYIRVIQPDIG